MTLLLKKAVVEALESIRTGANLSNSALIGLEVVRRGARQTGAGLLDPESVLTRLIREIAAQELGRLRSLYSTTATTEPRVRAGYKQRIAEDFRCRNRVLEAWSVVYHRYLLSNLDFQIQEIATAANNCSPKQIGRRMDRGVTLSTAAIADQEAALVNGVTEQRRRLLAQLPGFIGSELVGRESDLQTLSAELRNPTAFWVISIEGLGGIGKTALAHTLVDEAIREYLFANTVCISAQREVFRGERIETLPGPSLTSERFLDELIIRLEFGEALGSKLDAKFDLVRKKLRETPYLILVDNLETAEDTREITSHLDSFVNPTKAILTSRQHVAHHDFRTFKLKPLSKEATVQLVRKDAHARGIDAIASSTDYELQDIYRVTGGNPLAIKLVVGLLTQYEYPLEVALKRLAKAKGEAPDNFFRFIYRQAWQALSPSARRILFVLTQLPGGGTDESLRRKSRLDEDGFRTGLELLTQLSLVSVPDKEAKKSRYAIHPLTHRFVVEVAQKWQM